jgi:hypothetical protein
MKFHLPAIVDQKAKVSKTSFHAHISVKHSPKQNLLAKQQQRSQQQQRYPIGESK